MLKHTSSLGIQGTIDFTIIQHPGRDAGVRTTGPQILALQRTAYSHALLLLDHEGSGSKVPALELEAELDDRLGDPWGDGGKAIVIEPELDAWMWGSDNALAEVLGRPSGQEIRGWLRGRGFEFSEHGKLTRPKEALEELMRERRQPRSSSVYLKIARTISLEQCKDLSFHRLRETLQRWHTA